MHRLKEDDFIFGFKDRNKNRLEKIMEKTYEVFDETLPSLGYETRDGQTDMSYDIIEALRDRQHIVIEAGVGIGKSFAYLVPLLLYNRDYGEPILIATSSIALQEQLIDDINKMANILGFSPMVQLAKGMRNYACLKECLNVEQFENQNKENLQKLIELVKSGVIDKAKLPEISSKDWSKINAESCNSRTCENKDDCVFIRDRERLKIMNGIIVTNQDMLIKNLINRNAYKQEMFNKEIMCIVVDEGHNLEEKVRNAYTEKWTLNLIKKNINGIRDGMRYNQSYASTQAEPLFEVLNDIFSKLDRQINKELEKQEIDEGSRYHINVKDIEEELNKLEKQLDSYLIFATTNWDDRYETNDDALDNLYKFIRLLGDIKKEEPDSIYWLNRQGRGINRVSIESCQKEVKKVINELFFNDSKFKTVITSATLTHQRGKTDEESYSYFVNNTGFPTGKRSFFSSPKDSPFPYDEHSTLYISDRLPVYSDDSEGFINGAIGEILRLAEITDGKTLILFTSKKDMNEVYNRMKLLDTPWKILTQEDGSSQSDILENFKMDTNSILLGTGVFWEGISIEGEALSCVVIFRLPFPVPDPIIEYKSSIAKNRMEEVLLPHMIIKLKQGIGRLIRKDTDKGIVAILDPRLGDKDGRGYKETVWKALPIKNRTNKLEDIKVFYDSVCKIKN